MHHQTEHALIEQLRIDGLPDALVPAVRHLLSQIHDGHTAIELDAQAIATWQHSPWGQSAIATAPLAVTDGWLQTGRHRAQEARIASHLKARAKTIASQPIDALTLMPMADLSQQQAITGAAARQLALVLGGPGSGKTTTAAAIVTAKYHQLAQQKPPSIALLAPTGKAAVRLTEAFQNALSRMPEALRPRFTPKATTIHRQLDQLADYDLVLIDEASMVSLDLMDRLLARLDPAAHLIFMGDPDQLASVEAGSVLSTLAKSAAFAADRFVLAGRHRTDQGQALNRIQDRCLAGDFSGFMQALEDAQIRWIPSSDAHALEHAVIEGYGSYFDAIAAGQARPSPDFQCLTSISPGTGGRHWINRIVCQHAVMRGLDGVGHRILVTENQPSLEIYNGDIGVYLSPQSAANPEVWISGSERTLMLHQINQPETAYAISIHRSQGSEYPHVLVSLPDPPKQSRYQPTRELLYTALTRAKQSVALFASEAQLAAALATPTRRHSCLERFLAID